MNNRLELHELLCTILGSRNVYFQPPESIKLRYPCIVYELSRKSEIRASNIVYKRNDAYEVTVISNNPDNEMADKIVDAFEYASFDRRFVSDNLIHDVITIYY